ncbi:MAG: FAD-dependent oxidoreductase [Bacteroidota bacterium]
MYDFIIIGQGIAGSLLSWFLIKENQKVLLLDNYNPSSASNIASGISNAITGRRFVKTWLADDILPFAEKTYREFEQNLKQDFFHPLTIVRLFDSIKAQNDWSARCASTEYATYLKNEEVIYFDPEKVKNDFGGFEIAGGSKLEIEKFLALYRTYLKQKNILLEEKFSFNELKAEHDSVAYRNVQGKRIIFCEGAGAINNPYFKFLPFQLAKGECLLVNIPDFYPERMINGEVFIMPASTKDEYYVGSTHDWSFDDDQPSKQGKNELLGNLSAILKAKFEVIEHKGAIRPTVKDRRPFVGFHPEYSNIGIFNGMGTKGVSLAPFFAKHFTENLLHQKPLMKEVDIKRFV